MTRKHGRAMHHIHPRGAYVDEYMVTLVPADPDLPIELKVVGGRIDDMQKIVGGYIEIVRTHLMPRIMCGCQLVMVANEEGLLKRLPPNDRASIWYPGSDPIVGDVFIIAEGPTLEGRDFVTLRAEMRDWGGPGHTLPQPMRHPEDARTGR